MRSHPIAVRRGARILAAVGLLTASTGVAVLTTTTAEAAAPEGKVYVCHATNSDSNPFRFIEVAEESTQLEAHLDHQDNPNKIWKTDGEFQGVPHAAGDPKPDMVGVENAESCNDSNPPEDILVEADVTFVDPSCDNENEVSYATSSGEYTWSVSGEEAPGGEITVTATVNDGFTFADDAQQYSETHTFGPAVDLEAPPCARVDPPVVDPPVVTPPIVEPPVVEPPVVAPPVVKPPTVVPRVVKAGFGLPEGAELGAGLDDTGFALVAFGGGLLMVASAGMVASRRRETRA